MINTEDCNHMVDVLDYGERVHFNVMVNGKERNFIGYLYDDLIYYFAMPEGELISEQLSMNVIPSSSVIYTKEVRNV